MNRRTGLILALAVLGLWLGFLLWESGEAPGSPGDSRPMVAADAAGDLPRVGEESGGPDDIRALVGDADASVADEEPSATEPPSIGALIVHVRWGDDGSPAEGVGLLVVHWDAPDPLHSGVEGLTDPDGVWHGSDSPPGRATIYADRGGHAMAELVAGETIEVELTVPAGVWVHGVVVDPDERPVGGAGIWLSDYFNSTEGRIVARADENGRFALRSVGVAHYVGARSPRHAPSPLHLVQETATLEVELTLRLGGAAGSLSGTVTDAEGERVERALVVVGPDDGWLLDSEADPDADDGPAPFRTRTDADGAFRVDGVGVGNVRVVARAPGWSPVAAPAMIDSRKTAEVHLVLPRLAILAGTVTDASGAKLPGARISAGTYGDLWWHETESGDDGTFRLGLGAPHFHSLLAQLEGAGRADHHIWVDAGDQYAWDPVLSRGLVMHGRLVDEFGQVVAGPYTVQVEHDGPYDGWRRQSRVDEAGRFVIENLKDRVYVLEVFDFELAGPLPLAREVGVEPAEEERVVVVRSDARPSAGIVGRVVGPDGQRVEQLAVWIAPGELGIRLPAVVDERDGSFRAGPFLPGFCRVQVEAKGWPEELVPDIHLRANETTDVGLIRLRLPGTLVVRAMRSAGVPPGAGQLSIWRGGESVMNVGMEESGVVDLYRSGPLAPGAYDLWAHRGEFAEQHVSFEIEAGRDTELDMVLRRGHRTGFRVEDLPAEDRSDMLDLLLWDAEGQAVAIRRFLLASVREHDLPIAATIELAAGGYRCWVIVDGELVTQAEIVVPGPDPGFAEHVLRID